MQNYLRITRIIPIFARRILLLIQIYNVMKKIFTLVCMAFVAMSVNAQTEESYVAVDADGNVIAEYPSAIEAQRATGTNRKRIRMCCNGKYKTAGGYLWRFKE